jgi:hypothetical protein
LHDILLYLIKGEDTISSTITNTDGYYSFSSVQSGNYSIIAQINIAPGGFNNTDAIKIRRHFSNIEPITSPIRLLAADVNNSGGINNTDAVKIRRCFANLTTFERGDWVFMKPEGGNEIIINNSDVIQIFYGLCVGDVNGSYIPQ